MAQFVAFEPGVEVSGAVVIAAVGGLENGVPSILERHGLARLAPDEWYPQQDWLNVLYDIGSGPGFATMDLVSLGMRVPDQALWPPEITTVQAALERIDAAYQMHHRNGEIGHYRAERLGERHMRMICRTPYPSDFEYGILYRTTQKCLVRGTAFRVRRAESPSRLKGDDTCLYHITWEQECPSCP